MKMCGVCWGCARSVLSCAARAGRDFTVNMPFELIEPEFAMRKVEETTCMSAVDKERVLCVQRHARLGEASAQGNRRYRR